MHEQDLLCKLSSESGIHLVFLKGTAAAMYYSVPSLRSIDDIDLLDPQDRFFCAKKLMNAEDEEYEQHYSYKKDGVRFK